MEDPEAHGQGAPVELDVQEEGVREPGMAMQDSGCRLSLSCTPGNAAVALDTSRESGEITDDKFIPEEHDRNDRVQHFPAAMHPSQLQWKLNR